MPKKIIKCILICFWAVLYLFGCLQAPFATSTPRIGLSCALFFLSFLSILVLSIYEYRTAEQPKLLLKHIVKDWMAYLSNATAYVLILIGLRR